MIELVHRAGTSDSRAGDGDDYVEDVYGAEYVPGDDRWFRVGEK